MSCVDSSLRGSGVYSLAWMLHDRSTMASKCKTGVVALDLLIRSSLNRYYPEDSSGIK